MPPLFVTSSRDKMYQAFLSLSMSAFYRGIAKREVGEGGLGMRLLKMILLGIQMMPGTWSTLADNGLSIWAVVVSGCGWVCM